MLEETNSFTMDSGYVTDEMSKAGVPFRPIRDAFNLAPEDCLVGYSSKAKYYRPTVVRNKEVQDNQAWLETLCSEPDIVYPGISVLASPGAANEALAYAAQLSYMRIDASFKDLGVENRAQIVDNIVPVGWYTADARSLYQCKKELASKPNDFPSLYRPQIVVIHTLNNHLNRRVYAALCDLLDSSSAGVHFILVCSGLRPDVLGSDILSVSPDRFLVLSSNLDVDQHNSIREW